MSEKKSLQSSLVNNAERITSEFGVSIHKVDDQQFKWSFVFIEIQTV